MLYAKLGGHTVAVSADVARATIEDRISTLTVAIAALPEGATIRTALEDVQGHYTDVLAVLDDAAPAGGLDVMLVGYMQAEAAGAHACAIAFVDVFQCLGGQLVAAPSEAGSG